ncbi:family 78 glycoside hydrolase catalytic domain [Alkaliflexus imshenetskii]|uniref:family 78 glycoside hydrolase catalytic domain n=1 Tax=Alkaliflexus imshenetskii TaxID=286730 RepID=UPI00047DADE1|nr:family 78 glycoside hydrolase catalytic domain [Alkaliflexus imshenetskii]
MKKTLVLLSFILMKWYISVAMISPTNLLCEYTTNPSVVDVVNPRLSWVNIAHENVRGQKQTAWQIRVASAPEQLEQPDLWDSGKVLGNQSNRIEYSGISLHSRQECWWQVRVWDKDGHVSEWSEPAFWRMGLLKPTDWDARWIGAPWQGEATLPKPGWPGDFLPDELPPPAPLMRKSFNINKDIKKALVFTSGLGYFEIYLNGHKVGDDVLVPNQTNYGKRDGLEEQNIPLPDDFKEYKVMYLAYDVTEGLVQGENIVGSILGNGFYNPAKFWAQGYGSPRFIAQLHITYTDGTEEVIVTDDSWKVSKSAIIMDMVYYGEHYDARMEQPGWNAPGFDDSDWENVICRNAPEGKLVAHTANTDKVMERLKPCRIEKMYDGRWIVDFGEEVSGWVRLTDMNGPEGHKIETRYLSNSWSGDNSYVFSGKGNESYAARFNWFVFRQVEVLNWPGVLHPEQITAEVVYTSIDETALFETSSTLLNDINKIWKRTQTNNMHGGIVSDCPHRERSAYTGDGQVTCITVMHNYDARNFYQKWIHDIIGAQITKTGYVPNCAPWQPGCGGGVAWGAAISIMPWEYYVHYGAVDILEDSYPAMKEYLRYLQTWLGKDGIVHSQRKGRDGNVLRWFNLGDWAVPYQLPDEALVHTFYFWRCVDYTAKTAAVLGKTKEANRYAKLAEATKRAFHKRFYNSQHGTYGPFGGNLFALVMGVPSDRYERVVSALKKEIAANNGHLDTGIFGTQFFFETLSEHGMHELAWEAMVKTDEPSYGRWLALGATTMWEYWDTGGSHNHPMFGSGITWFYRKLAGINTNPDEPGYRHILFRPQPVGCLSFVKYYNTTAFGKAGIHWKKGESCFTMNITVPVGSYATVYVPGEKNSKLTESGSPLKNQPHVQYVNWVDGYHMVKVESGEYSFEVR